MTDNHEDITTGMVSADHAAMELGLLIAEPEPTPSSADVFVTFPNGTFVRLTANTGSTTAELVFGDSEDVRSRIQAEVGLIDLNALQTALSLIQDHVLTARSLARERG